MILDVIPAVRQLLPTLLDGVEASVACVRTTRPKYLVFGADSARPLCVVEFGDSSRLLNTYAVLSVLSAEMPGIVPAPLCCEAWRGHSVLIQQGLGGTPWFRVADAVRGEAAWRTLIARASTVLMKLHTAVGAVPQWQATVNLGAELARQSAAARASGVLLSADAQRCIEGWSAAAGSDLVRTCWQHGDFSLNNLLVDRDALAIIDFDEFGATTVPLHDVFGLALSVGLSQERSPLSRQQCLAACLAQARGHEAVPPAQVPAALMHHLLWRVNQCRGLERRAALRRILLAWIDELATAPEVFLGPAATGYSLTSA